MDMTTTGENVVSQDGARNLPHDHVGQNGAKNLPYDRSEHRTMGARDNPWDPYPSRYDTRNHIPPEAPPHRQVRGTVPDVDMRSALDTTSQQIRDLASLVSQLASEVLLLKSNPTPPATTADNNSPNPLTPDVVGCPPAVPLPVPPVVPTGEPVHYASDTRPKHTVKLEHNAGQGASFEAFLAKYEEHSRY